MLTQEESEKLMARLISLRQKYKKTKSSKILEKLNNHERMCMEKFKYLVTMRTSRYKNFSNYDDLNQEGFEALLRAMKNYDPKKGCFFWWAHKYIETRISRSANLHTAIRFPLKFAKLNTPHRESSLPDLVEERFGPDLTLEGVEAVSVVKLAVKKLEKDQQTIVSLAFGFDGDRPLSINKICKKMNISRLNCIKSINSALITLKHNISL